MRDGVSVTRLIPCIGVMSVSGGYRYLFRVLNSCGRKGSGLRIRIGLRVDRQWFRRLRHGHCVTVQATI